MLIYLKLRVWWVSSVIGFPTQPFGICILSMAAMVAAMSVMWCSVLVLPGLTFQPMKTNGMWES